MISKNKRGISPLIATVLIIGFTIVLAALVITWGTKLFKTTVAETESTSKFSLACTTGLRLEVTGRNPSVITPTTTSYSVILRNNNQDRIISDFRAVLNFASGSVEGVVSPASGTDRTLTFPIPKTYNFRKADSTTLTGLNSIDLYPIFVIDGETKACENPTEVKTA